MNKYKVRLSVVSLVLLILQISATRVDAIEWCHDYVFHVISKGGDSNGMPGPTLRKELQARGYEIFKILLPGTINESRFLKKGDVVIFFGESDSGEIIDSHSGVVVDDQGRIDHFLQKYGTTMSTKNNPNARNVTYTPTEAKTAYDEVLGTNLLRRGWMIQQIRTFNYNIPSRGVASTGAGRFAHAKVAVFRPTVDLVVQVLEAESNKKIEDAEVRVRSISTGAEIVAVLTNAGGSTGKLAIPGDAIARGLQIRAKSKGHKEKWSDVARELLSWSEERNFTIILDLSIEAQLYRTWRFDHQEVEFRRDGSATYRDSLNKSNFSNKFTIITKWSTETELWIELLNPTVKNHRLVFVLKDGKLQFPGPVG